MMDPLANEVVLKLQPGVMALVENKGPPSPRGKCKWGGRNPADVTGQASCTAGGVGGQGLTPNGKLWRREQNQ
jgi:hypothetical protein